MITAVTWLDQQIKEKMGLDEHDTNQLKWFIDKALEKEKKQIEKAVEDTRGNIVPRMFISENLSGENYYNQIYNQNK